MTPAPAPEAIRAAREAAGQSQAQAAGLVHLRSPMRWSEYERGVRQIDAARWELYLLLTGQHPSLRFDFLSQVEANSASKIPKRTKAAIAAT